MFDNPKRQLGRNGPIIPALGYGALSLSSFTQVETEDQLKEHQALLRKVLDSGISHIDTSMLYGGGRNEELIGSILEDAAYRKKTFIATKFGLIFGTMFDPNGMSCSGKPTDIREWIELSLKRLKVDYIDLYYQHRVDRTIPIEETWNELKKLKEEGKVKYLGISEATPEEIRRAHSVTPISACQIEFSMWTPDIRTNGILDVCRELGIAIVAYSPLGRGFLTGTLKSAEDIGSDDSRIGTPRFEKGAFEENLKFVEAIKKVGEKKDCTPAQLALAWVLAQGEDFFVIPGTKSEKYFLENIGCLKVQLTPEDLKELDEIVEKIKIVGDRYPRWLASANAF